MPSSPVCPPGLSPEASWRTAALTSVPRARQALSKGVVTECVRDRRWQKGQTGFEKAGWGMLGLVAPGRSVRGTHTRAQQGPSLGEAAGKPALRGNRKAEGKGRAGGSAQHRHSRFLKRGGPTRPGSLSVLAQSLLPVAEPRFCPAEPQAWERGARLGARVKGVVGEAWASLLPFEQ